MDSAIKRKVLANSVPAIVVPVVRAAVSHHYRMKEYDRQEEMAVSVAEQKANSVERITQARGGGFGQPHRASMPGHDDPANVYNALRDLKAETDCSFCHQAIDRLREDDVPPEDARRGYEELRAYIGEVQRLEGSNLSADESREIVRDLVDGWDALPTYMVSL